jgi:hypothetical protein
MWKIIVDKLIRFFSTTELSATEVCSEVSSFTWTDVSMVISVGTGYTNIHCLISQADH